MTHLGHFLGYGAGGRFGRFCCGQQARRRARLKALRRRSGFRWVPRFRFYFYDSVFGPKTAFEKTHELQVAAVVRVSQCSVGLTEWFLEQYPTVLRKQAVAFVEQGGECLPATS